MLRSAFRIKSALSSLSTALFVSAGLFCAGASAQDKKVETVDIAKGQQIASQACAACHAANGNATAPANPKLAAQHPEYLAKQLHNFKVKPGAKEAERANAIMAGFAAGLSDADIKNVAAYFATQKLQPAFAKDKDLSELGKKIYRGGIAEKNIPACAGCHGATGAGMPAQYPRLGGQWSEYTEAQLTAYRQGVRKNNAQMVTIASRLSDREIKAVSDYVAGLR
jgi:cbb3-type cytochrome c oxidase subunit III